MKFVDDDDDDVRFGLPRLLLPPSGVQSNTKLAGLDIGRRNTCPMNLLRLVATVSCRSPTPAFCIIITDYYFRADTFLICRQVIIDVYSM